MYPVSNIHQIHRYSTNLKSNFSYNVYADTTNNFRKLYNSV